MAEQFEESIANKEDELRRKILWAVGAVIIGLVILRISCPAISSHLPFGPSTRTLLARQVDAYDPTHDGKRIALLSGGILKSISSNGDGIRDLGNRPIIIPGYEWAEVRWSGDDSKIAVGTYYKKGNSPLMIFDLAAGTSQEIARALSLGSFVWFGGSDQLAWIQHDAVSSERHRRRKSSIFFWNKIGRPRAVYGDQHSGSSGISRLKYIPHTGNMGFIENRFSVEALVKEQPLDRIRIIRPDGTEVRAIKPPPGRFRPPGAEFRSWDVSSIAKQIAHNYGWGIWVTSLESGAQPRRIAVGFPFEMCWSPDGKKLAFVTTSPNSPTPGIGAIAQGPPHELHVINKDGSGHRLVCTEPQGIKSIEWLNNNELLYLSGKDLIRRKL